MNWRFWQKQKDAKDIEEDKPFKLLNGTLGDITRLLELQWSTQKGYGNEERGRCKFCGAKIYYVDAYFYGISDDGDCTITACQKCGVAAGLKW